MFIAKPKREAWQVAAFYAANVVIWFHINPDKVRYILYPNSIGINAAFTT
jgi:hypothetical protein